MSSTFLIRLFSINVSIVSLPKPSISNPALEPKNIIPSFLARLQDSFSLHLGTFSSSLNSIVESPQGQLVGKLHIF